MSSFDTDRLILPPRAIFIFRKQLEKKMFFDTTNKLDKCLNNSVQNR